MKRFLCLGFILISFTGFAQFSFNPVDINYEDLLGTVKEKLDSLKNDPDSWDSVLDELEGLVEKKDTTLAKWLNDLNIDFKTFQNADSSKASLGFSYNLNIERAKIDYRGHMLHGKSISFESIGNVAFKKEVNPTDFLNSRLALNFFHSGGGVPVRDASVADTTLARWRREMAMLSIQDVDITKTDQWREYNEAFPLTNDWIIKYDINAGIESNQDFSLVQNTFGLRVGTAIKAWDEDNLLAKLNIVDYPFALIRRITGYDRTIRASGATIPSLLLGFDYVLPTNDTIREGILDDAKAYPRFNIEIAYRTVITEVASQTLYFNSSFRYFMEIGAPAEIKENKLDMFSYFVASLTASSGFYLSYSYGKLPFDRQNDAVYELGFSYKFK